MQCLFLSQTIFEINKTNKTEAFSVMKRKRSRHSDAIHATSIRRQKRRTDAISDADDLTHSNAQMSTESDMLVSVVSIRIVSE